MFYYLAIFVSPRTNRTTKSNTMKGITVTNTVGTAVLDQLGNKSPAELNTKDNMMIAPIITKIASSILPVTAFPFL